MVPQNYITMENAGKADLEMNFWPTDRFYAESFDAVFASSPATQAEPELLLRRASELGGPILDVGCGSGRLLVTLGEAGHEVFGVESSPGQWEMLMQRLKKQPLDVAARITVQQQDMFDMQLDQRFRILFSNSWYLTNEAHNISRLIRTMAYGCLEGGRIILSDFSWMRNMRDHYLGKPSERQGVAEDGNVFRHTKTYHYEADKGILRADVVVEKRSAAGNTIQSQTYSWRAKFIDDRLFEELVHQAGCEICRTHENAVASERWFELRVIEKK